MSKKILIDNSDKKGFFLAVPFYSQRDNIIEWWRTCNSSSCAMAAEYLQPGCIRNSDDEYIYLIRQYGDTTSHEAQTKTLESLGIQSEFHYDLDYSDLDAELEDDRPVVIGIAHRGNLESPKGGHMVVVIGRYERVNEQQQVGYICHDPWGEGFGSRYDLGFIGSRVYYPKQSLDQRWLIDGPNSGWGRIFRKS